jgi:hypothetical protein
MYKRNVSMGHKFIRIDCHVTHPISDRAKALMIPQHMSKSKVPFST